MKMTKEAELLNCPFCGGRPTMHCGGPGNWFLQCNGCKCATNDVQHDHAIELWNTRAQPQSSQQSAVEVERGRCLAACEGWIERYQNTEIKYTSARDYAIDAVKDIADLIRNGTPISRPLRPDTSQLGNSQ